MITKADKDYILDALKMVDVKKLEIDLSGESHSPEVVELLKKWFRFGSYNGMMISSEIIKNLPSNRKKTVDK